MEQFFEIAPNVYLLKVPFGPVWTGVVLLRGEKNILIDSSATARDVDEIVIPALAALSVGDIGMMIFAESASGVPFFTGVLACIASFAAAFGGILLMRFLVQKDTLEGFACYNWGIAMFAFIIYLIG